MKKLAPLFLTLLLLGACTQSPRPVTPQPPQPLPTVLGVGELVFSGLGTAGFTASVQYDGQGDVQAQTLPGWDPNFFLPFEVIARSSVDYGAHRYVSLTVEFTNDPALGFGTVQNLTLLPVSHAGTVGLSPFTRAERFDGSAFAGGLANLKPTQPMRMSGRNLIVDNERATFVAYAEHEVPATPNPAIETVFPYGWAAQVHNAWSWWGSNRTIEPGNSGIMTISYRLPIISPQEDLFNFRVAFVVTQDGSFRNAQSLDERTEAGWQAVMARAQGSYYGNPTRTVVAIGSGQRDFGNEQHSLVGLHNLRLTGTAAAPEGWLLPAAEAGMPDFVSRTVYVSPEGNDSHNGSWTQPFRTVQHALQRVLEDGTVNVQPGVYAENLHITRNVALNGLHDWQNPARPTIQPTLRSATGAIIEVGDTSDAGSLVLRASINNLTVDGSLVAPSISSEALPFYGIYFRNGSSGSISNNTLRGVKGANPGMNNGLAIVAINHNTTPFYGNSFYINANRIEDYGRAALLLGGTGNAFDVFQNEVNGRTAEEGEGLQYGLMVFGENNLFALGNHFANLGLSGVPQPAFGHARVSPNGEIGYAIHINDFLGFSNFYWNSFTNVQGILFDSRDAASATPIANFITDNNFSDPRYMVPGALSNVNRPILLGRHGADPNLLNYLLTMVNSNRTITLSSGNYTLTSCLLNPSHVALVGAGGGQVTISIPNSTRPANVVPGDGVTIVTGTTPCP